MHNCLSIPFDKLLANGFTTRQTDVRGANSINTASQLVAVIFQIQSLQQFGGVSATHIDWTMVPYVRKSFYKHFIDGLKYAEDFTDEEITKFIRDLRQDEQICIEIKDISIVNEKYKKFKNAYRYAMDMTHKEAHQAVEGLFHNL